MTALIEEAPNPAPAAYAGPAAAEAERAATGVNGTADILKSRMPELVKGAGMAHRGGNMPLSDPVQIMVKANQATIDLRKASHDGYHNRAHVVKSAFTPGFMSQRPGLATALSAPSLGEQLQQFASLLPGGGSDALKSFTAGNLGIGSVYGLTPFNLDGVLAS